MSHLSSRRKDHKPSTQNDRMCSCHFVDGKKENGPSIFPWPTGRTFNYVDPDIKKKTFVT